jgi:chromosome segregation ATPase
MRPDPARVALASAITAASQADKALKQANDALERAETFVAEAQGRVDQASAAVSHAVNEQAAALAEAFAGNQDSPAMGAATRAARMRMADCEDELTASRSTLEKLRDAVREREDAVGEARRAVDEATAGVVAGHVEILLEEARRAQLQYLEACAVLTEAQRALHPWSGEHKAAANFLGAVHFAVNRHLGAGNSAAAAEWRLAVAELARDASVPLPG